MHALFSYLSQILSEIKTTYVREDNAFFHSCLFTGNINHKEISVMNKLK